MENITPTDKPYIGTVIFPFVLPKDMQMRAKIICAKRGISLAEFAREGMRKNIKKYERFLK